MKKIMLVGNPNVGKSVLFNLLTKKYTIISNYPGTTIEVSHSPAAFQGGGEIYDTPGINSLVPFSIDEKVTSSMLLEEKGVTVIQVADAKNLGRALIITSQLSDMNIPTVLALNMYDEAEARGYAFDTKKLSDILGIPVIITVAVEKRGIPKLISHLCRASVPRLRVDYGENLEQRIAGISQGCSDAGFARFLSLMLVSMPESCEDIKNRFFKDICGDAVPEGGDPGGREGLNTNYFIEKKRSADINSILDRVILKKPRQKRGFAEKLGIYMQHPVWGLPFAAAVLLAVYYIVGVFGAGITVDFLENTVFGKYINPVIGTLVDRLVPFDMVRDAFMGEYGLVTMGLTYAIAIVCPIVGYFFFIFSILEDCGYLPRLAIMTNRLFKLIGLNGKAVLPFVLGLGCDTMATLTARILETKKERLITTLLLALAIPCSAQLGVILGIFGSMPFYYFALYTAVILFQFLLVGWLSSRIFKGAPSDFIVEIPPVRMPSLANIIIKTLYRVKWFLFEAVPLFLAGTFFIFILDKTGVLGFLERLAAPVVKSMLSLPGEMTRVFIMGFLRRDYGAAGLRQFYTSGAIDNFQVFVSMVVITLFIPCVANFFVIIKEQGAKRAIYMAAFIFPFAFFTGAVINWAARLAF